MSTLVANRETTPRSQSPAGEVPTTQVNGTREVREGYFLSGPVPTAPDFPFFVQEHPADARPQQSKALVRPKAKPKQSAPQPPAAAVVRPRLDVALADALKSEATLVGTEQADVEKKPVELEEPASVTRTKVLTDVATVFGGVLIAGCLVASIVGIISVCEGQKGLTRDQAGLKKFGPDTIAYEGTITWSQAVEMDRTYLQTGRGALYAAIGLGGGALLSLALAVCFSRLRKRTSASASQV